MPKVGGIDVAQFCQLFVSYVAQTEREFIRQRQAEGIAAAKARGVQFGRKPMPRPNGYEETKKLWQDGEISAREAARRLNISHRTFLLWGKDKTDKLVHVFVKKDLRRIVKNDMF